MTTGCSRQATNPSTTDERLHVFAGIPPLAFLVGQIGGPYVTVDVLLRAGQDPHTFEPTPRQALALAQAAMFFKIDMPFENLVLEKIRQGNRQLQVVDTTEGIWKRSMRFSCSHHEGHDGHHDHDHAAHEGEPDPHVWLSPPLLKIMARNIATALCRIDPAHQSYYQRNLAVLVERLDTLDKIVRLRLAPYHGRSFYVFHPAFGYFADEYHLREEAIESDGRGPTPVHLHSLVEKAKAEGITTIFVQPQNAPESAQAVAQAIGGRVVTLNGLNRDVIAGIEDIAVKIEAAMKEKSEGGRRRAEGGEGNGPRPTHNRSQNSTSRIPSQQIRPPPSALRLYPTSFAIADE